MNIRIKAILAFKDGNILPGEIRAGEETEVTANQWAQIKQSGGVFEVLGAVIPKHVPAAPVEAEEPPKTRSRKRTLTSE